MAQQEVEASWQELQGWRGSSGLANLQEGGGPSLGGGGAVPWRQRLGLVHEEGDEVHIYFGPSSLLRSMMMSSKWGRAAVIC